MTKECVKCNTQKDLSDFRKDKSSKDGRRNECKACRNSYMSVMRRNPDGRWAKRERAINDRCRNVGRERNQKIVNEIKAVGCAICKYSRCLRGLHFHHLKDKKYDVGTLVAQGASFDKLMDEISKCVILCANCHTELHEGLISI